MLEISISVVGFRSFMNGPLAYPRVPQKPPLPPRPRQPSMQHCLVHTEIAMPGIGGQARKFIVAHVDQRFVIPRFEIDVRLTSVVKIGRASVKDRSCQYVEISVVAE